MFLRISNMITKLIWALRVRSLDFAQKGRNVTLVPPFQIAFANRCELGSDIHIGAGASLFTQGGLRIEDGVIIGPNFTVYTANHHYEDAEAVPYDGRVFLEPVHIKENVWIGGNVIVVPGVTIGEGAVVAAGAVVTRDVPDCALVGGNPARVIKYRDERKYLQLKAQNKIYLRMKQQGQIRISEVKQKTYNSKGPFDEGV